MTSLALDEDPRIRRDTAARALAFFLKEPGVRVDAQMIDEMRRVSRANAGCEVRVCLHASPEDPHHDMVILATRGHAIPPHFHPTKSETMHVIEGELGLVFYDDDGRALRAEILAAGELLRVEPNQTHISLPLGDTVVFHESKAGPYRVGFDTRTASWAPAPGTPESARVVENAEALLARARGRA